MTGPRSQWGGHPTGQPLSEATKTIAVTPTFRITKAPASLFSASSPLSEPANRNYRLSRKEDRNSVKSIMRTGGEILIEQLARHGVARIFTVPGESFLPVLDALHGQDSVSPVTCRNEAGAAMMAEATGKLLGRPGVALVSRGPGAANALPGVYIASQDGSPMVLLIGLPAQGLADLPAFQAIDVEGVFGPLAKWVTIVAHAGDIASAVQRGFKIANAGRPGPVVIGLPEDILSQQTSAVSVVPAAIESLGPSAANLDALQYMLANAQRPLFSPVVASGARRQPLRWQNLPNALICQLRHLFGGRTISTIAIPVMRATLASTWTPYCARLLAIAISSLCWEMR